MQTPKAIPILIGCAAFVTAVSAVLSVGIVRLCVASAAASPLSIRSLVCGNDLNAGYAGFKRLAAENIFIESGVLESQEHSINKGTEAAKLVDGNKTTLAAPANQNIDYIITFTEPYRIRQTVITWGDYGINANYVSHWKLEAKGEAGAWKTVEEGNLPKSKETVVNKAFEAASVRLTAESAKDWIGAYEIELVGRPI